MFSRRVNAPGMLLGGMVGIAASLVVSFSVRQLALQYYAAVNLLVTIVPCYLFSRLAAHLGHVQPAEAVSWSWRAWRTRN